MKRPAICSVGAIPGTKQPTLIAEHAVEWCQWKSCVSANLVAERTVCGSLANGRTVAQTEQESGIRKALFILGYYDVYHMTSFMNENPRDGELWAAAADAKFYGKGHFGKEEWDQLLGHCMVYTYFLLLGRHSSSLRSCKCGELIQIPTSQAVTDFPANAFVPELVSTYPEAKVVLNLADSEDAFYKSYMTTIWPLNRISTPLNPSLFHRFVLWVVPKFPTQDTVSRLIRGLDLQDFPKTGKKFYQEHNEGVRRVVPKENLLEFNVKQGWGPLCEFLGKDVPDVPFPHVNDRAEFRRNQRRIMVMAGVSFGLQLLKYVGGFGVLAGGVWWAWRRRN